MATEMLGGGIPVPTVSQRLGHARPSTTLNLYAHRIPGADRHAADLLGQLLTDTQTPARTARAVSLTAPPGQWRAPLLRRDAR